MTSILNGNDNSGDSPPCGLHMNKAKQWVLAVIAVVVVAVVGAVAATTVGGSSSKSSNKYRAAPPIHSQAEIHWQPNLVGPNAHPSHPAQRNWHGEQ
jgi:hypothetical protein